VHLERLNIRKKNVNTLLNERYILIIKQSNVHRSFQTWKAGHRHHLDIFCFFLLGSVPLRLEVLKDPWLGAAFLVLI
jgi:hypothetical protein